MDFSIKMPVLGGLLIGLSAALLMFSYGKICGLSGIFSSMMMNPKQGWRWNFFIGFVAGAWILKWFAPEFVNVTKSFSMPIVLAIISGLLVGYGTKTGGGCTSGHGVCGVSRLSKRSIVATFVFIFTAMIVVFLRKMS